jgi:hypothetical protein
MDSLTKAICRLQNWEKNNSYSVQEARSCRTKRTNDEVQSKAEILEVPGEELVSVCVQKSTVGRQWKQKKMHLLKKNETWCKRKLPPSFSVLSLLDSAPIFKTGLPLSFLTHMPIFYEDTITDTPQMGFTSFLILHNPVRLIIMINHYNKYSSLK